MNARFKKWLLVTLKVGILLGIIEYARRQSQLDDEIAIPQLAATALTEWAARGGATGTVRGGKIVLLSPEGHPVEVSPGARLRVIGEPATSGSASSGRLQGRRSPPLTEPSQQGRTQPKPKGETGSSLQRVTSKGLLFPKNETVRFRLPFCQGCARSFITSTSAMSR